MPDDKSRWTTTVKRESLLFLWLLLAGLVLLPMAVYIVGRQVFGDYGGAGFPAFYGMLHSDLRSGRPAIWFLVLSPYLVWQTARLTHYAFRRASRG